MKKLKLNLVKEDLFLSFETKTINDKKILDKAEIEACGDGYIVKRMIKNISSEIIKLSEIEAKISNISFYGKPINDYFYANENARIYGSFTIPIDYDRENLDNPKNSSFEFKADTFWADPEVAGKRILSSPYQPVPAILLSNYESNLGLIVGSLSQDVFYHNFEVCHKDDKIELSIFSSFKDIAYREFLPNEELIDLWYVCSSENANDINAIFDGYISVLKNYLTDNAGSTNINRHTMIWDSWNDGIYRDVSEKMLIKEAQAVKKYFPNVEWFQLDDGYSAFCDSNVDSNAHGIGVAYEGDDGIDKIKFPNGLKGYTDKIKEIGLKPAIWIGGFCPVQTKIYKEHKDWFLDYSYRVTSTQPLDVSKKEVQEYMTYALDKLLVESGFEGIKHDFWSYAFEDKHDLLANKGKSGYEWRKWWHNEIRKRLPSYGYMETGCDVSMGNPFIGKYFNNYRLGLDIGAGKWLNVITTMFWTVSMLSNHTGDLFVPNSDSIGLLPNLNETDFIFLVNFQIITRTLVEISGRFSQVKEDNPRLKVIQKATKYLNNGEDVYFAKFDYRKTGMNLPNIIYIKSLFDQANSFGDVRTVALFNAEEVTKEISFSMNDLGLNNKKYVLENVWTGEKEIKDGLSLTLTPHESKLYKIYSL